MSSTQPPQELTTALTQSQITYAHHEIHPAQNDLHTWVIPVWNVKRSKVDKLEKQLGYRIDYSSNGLMNLYFKKTASKKISSAANFFGGSGGDSDEDSDSTHSSSKNKTSALTFIGLMVIICAVFAVGLGIYLQAPAVVAGAAPSSSS